MEALNSPVMHELFDRLTQQGEAGIEELKTTRCQESVELEFKTKSNPKVGELSKEDRKNLGVTLSALSNSMGGLLIWGIVASKNTDGVDCASDLQPVLQLEKFKNEVERAVSQVLMPRHDAVKIAAIASSLAPGSGYLLIHVERSERRPHRCEADQKQYFKRIGDSSIAMEHYDIEDSFKRFVVPTLDVELQISAGRRQSGPEGNVVAARLVLSLRNSSSVSARFPYLTVEKARNARRPTWSTKSERFIGTADHIVHPDQTLQAVELEREVSIEVGRGGEHIWKAKTADTVIDYTCGCLNSRPRTGRLTITATMIAGALNLRCKID